MSFYNFSSNPETQDTRKSNILFIMESGKKYQTGRLKKFESPQALN